MKKTTAIIYNVSFIAILIISVVACNKKFDAPPPYAPPGLTPTLTIAQLKAMHTAGSNETISNDDVIKGTVVANDSSGNFYKQIVIEDSTGGISVNIDDYNLYTSYPEGRQIFIKLKGLILYDDNRLVELGGSKDATGAVSPIASPVKDNYVIKGALGNLVAPKVVDVTSLNDSYQNMLVQLNDFEFDDADTSKIYADTSSSKNSVSFTLKNCSSKSITLRTSGYASFAGVNVPNGSGSINAIYSVYNSSKQLYIRDTNDVQFNNTRCNGGPAVQTTIANIRSMYKNSDIKLGAYKIGGVVISDASNKNISSGSVILQDGNAGISVYLGGSVTYNIGDSINIDVSGDTLKNYNGSLEIDSYGTTPTLAAAGKTVIPQTITIAQLNSNISTIENTLVKIMRAAASGNPTYSGSNVITDVTGNIFLFTSSSALFAGNALPSDTSDWIGYAKIFGSTKEFQIRNTTDVTKSADSISTGDGIQLAASPFILNFDDIASGLPAGVFVKTSATSASIGMDGTYSVNQASWSNTSSGFKNYASATGLTSTSDATAQDASLNRALGVKQTSAAGFDPGAAFVFKINNTSGKTNLALSFLLQSLYAAAGRTTTWQVDYALGDNPTTFTPVTTSPSAITTGPAFASTPVTVNFGSALDNQNGKVWIRIVALSATTGSSSRASTGIDDLSLSWQ